MDRTPALWGMYRIKVTQSYGLYLESKKWSIAKLDRRARVPHPHPPRPPRAGLPLHPCLCGREPRLESGLANPSHPHPVPPHLRLYLASVFPCYPLLALPPPAFGVPSLSLVVCPEPYTCSPSQGTPVQPAPPPLVPHVDAYSSLHPHPQHPPDFAAPRPPPPPPIPTHPHTPKVAPPPYPTRTPSPH